MRDSKVLLEFMCTANFDRSPTFRDVAQYVITQRGLELEIEVSASGTRADKIRQLASPMRIQHKVISLGHKLGVYDPSEQEAVERILAEGPDGEKTEEKRILYARSLQVLRARGGLFRGIALAQRGISVSDSIFRQTQAYNDLDVALGMKESNVGHAQKIYAQSPASPVIVTFQAYVGTQEVAPDPMGKGQEAYSALTDYALRHVAQAIERTLDERTT